MTDLCGPQRQESPAASASPAAATPVAVDEAGFDGNAADDENSEPDTPSREQKRSRRTSSVHITTEDDLLGSVQSELLSSPSPDPELTPIQQSPATLPQWQPVDIVPAVVRGPANATEKDSDSLTRQSPPAIHSPTVDTSLTSELDRLDINFDGDGETEASVGHELIQRLKCQNIKLSSECNFLKKSMRELNNAHQQANMQLIGARHANALLNEKYDQASGRRDEAMKAMVLAKNDARRDRRDKEKFEADYMDAMRQRDEALALCDRLNAESQSAARIASANGDKDGQELARKYEMEAKKLSEKCTQLQQAVLAAQEARERAVEEREVELLSSMWNFCMCLSLSE